LILKPFFFFFNVRTPILNFDLKSREGITRKKKVFV